MKTKLHLCCFSKIIKNFAVCIVLLICTGLNAQITTFPWTETFEDNSASLQNWSQIYESGNMSWTFAASASVGSYGLAPYAGAKMANFRADSWNGEKTKLVSPVVNLSGITNPTLNFYYVNPTWGGDQNFLKVFYRTSATGTWTQIALFNTNAPGWTSSGTITLPSPSATYQIALQGETFYGYSILVDQLVINGTSNPIAVTGVDVITQNNVPAQITTAAGTLQLVATVNPAGANQGVTWSIVSGGQYASVNANGTVTAIANGIVTVRATSTTDTTKFDDIQITINAPLPVTSVDVTTQGGVPTLIITTGGTLQLVAAVIPAGANQGVTWSIVSGGQYASVSANGTVTAIANGTVTIRATSTADTTKFDDIQITINVPVSSVDVSTQGGVPTEIITTGGTLQLVAVVNPAGVNQSVTWSIVSGGEYASVSANGTVTATANGTVTVRATSVTDPTKFDDIQITINAPIPVSSVVVTTQGSVPAQISTTGGTLQLVAVVNPAGANQSVTWSIVNGDEYASVSANGTVTATANGTVTVRATSVADPTMFDEIQITINAPIPATSVEVSTQNNVAAQITTVGGTLQLVAVVNPAGANQSVTWSIVNGSEYASVSANGTVTAIANGTVTVKATSIADPTMFDDIEIVISGQVLDTKDFDAITIKVFPNPVNDVVQITTNITIQSAQLYNLLGQQVVTKTVNSNEAQLDLSSFAAGNYILKLTIEGNAKTFKIVKK